jgi:hypothetical protein
MLRLVNRLFKMGMNSEEVKEWFVGAIPRALRSRALPTRRSMPHNVAVPTNAPYDGTGGIDGRA